MCETVRTAPVEKQLALIQAHPDLVGRAALAGTLTTESTKEQASAGLNNLTADEIALFQKQNTAYREKFGFPVCHLRAFKQKGSHHRRLRTPPAKHRATRKSKPLSKKFLKSPTAACAI